MLKDEEMKPVKSAIAQNKRNVKTVTKSQTENVVPTFEEGLR